MNKALTRYVEQAKRRGASCSAISDVEQDCTTVGDAVQQLLPEDLAWAYLHMDLPRSLQRQLLKRLDSCHLFGALNDWYRMREWVRSPSSPNSRMRTCHLKRAVMIRRLELVHVRQLVTCAAPPTDNFQAPRADVRLLQRRERELEAAL